MSVGLAMTTFDELVFQLPRIFQLFSWIACLDCPHSTYSFDSFSWYDWLIGSFRTVMSPLVAINFSFVDYSVIQFSLLLSFYLEQLRIKVTQWSTMNAYDKEHLRRICWNVQKLAKVKNQPTYADMIANLT